MAKKLEDKVIEFVAGCIALYLAMQVFAGIFGAIYGGVVEKPRCLPDSIFGRANIGFNAGCELMKPRYK